MAAKRIVFLGAPGAGKGTQAKILASVESLAHISTGDMLRAEVAAKSVLGLRVAEIMDSGQLVSDDLIVEIIKNRVGAADCQNGYILDGFPRTVPQAEALNQMLDEVGQQLSAVLFFNVSEDDVLLRLKIRQESEGRVDDSAETQLKRLRVYREQTSPLIEFYRREGMLTEVDGSGDVLQISARVRKVVDALSA